MYQWTFFLESDYALSLVVTFTVHKPSLVRSSAILWSISGFERALTVSFVSLLPNIMICILHDNNYQIISIIAVSCEFDEKWIKCHRKHQFIKTHLFIE